MKKPVRQDATSFSPTERCRDCGCWLRSGNKTGRCALHTKDHDSRSAKSMTPPEPVVPH